MSSDNNVVISPEVHKPRLELMKAPVGSTLTEILRCAINEGKMDAGDLPYVEIRVNGVLQPRREEVLDRCLKDNEVVQISMAVRGDNPLKTAFQLLVQVTAIVVGFYFGPWASAAVQAVGALATSALFPNRQDRLPSANSTSALSEQSNSVRRRAPMPLVLGRQRVAFDVAAMSYTQNIGSDSWLNVIFGIHYGPCTVEDIKIGETLLSDYPADAYKVEYFLTPGPRNSALYPGAVYQENLNNKFEFAGVPGGETIIQTLQPNATSGEVDIALPGGLSYTTDKGKVRNEEIAGAIHIAEEGTEVWIPAPFPGNDTARDKDNNLLPAGSFYLNMKTQNAIRRTYPFALDPTKNWKVRVRVYDKDGDSAEDPGHNWDTYLTAVRSKFAGKPIVDETLACMVLRIKASGDLGNSLPTISGIVTPIVPVYKDGNWATEEPSSNHAALLRWVLTGPPAARPLLPAQINASCEAVYDLIEARNWHAAFNVIEEVSQEDVMRLCGMAGRFATYWSGEDLCFVGDWEKPIPRQVFSAANISGYKYRREFQDEIHAVLVEYQNLDEDSRSDELWVYADGYDANTATLFESYSLQYAVTQNRAYKEGRVYLARRELKTETHEWTAAFDSVTSTFGDRVRVGHYAALYGEDTGRVVNRWYNADKTKVIGIRVDFAAERLAGQSYSIDVRRTNESIVGILLAGPAQVSKNLYFAAQLDVADAPRKDDLVVFGKTNLVTEDVEIDSFEPQSQTEVRISASPYVAELIEAAENGPIPPLPNNLKPVQPVPQVRIIHKIGTPQGAQVIFDILERPDNPISGFVAKWQYSSDIDTEGSWNTLPLLGPDAREVRTPPLSRPSFDLDDPTDGSLSVDIQITTLAKRGDSSRPVVVSNIEILKGVLPPTGLDAIAVVRTAPDGTSYPAIAVICDPVTAGDVQYLEVEIAVDEPILEWNSAGQPLPASNPIGDFTGVLGGEDYRIQARWRTQDNWRSDWVPVPGVIHVASGSLVATPGPVVFPDGTAPIWNYDTASELPPIPEEGQTIAYVEDEGKLYTWKEGIGWSKTIDGTDVDPGTIGHTAFAAGLQPVGVGEELPALPNAKWLLGSMFVLTTDGKTYTNKAGAWSSTIDASDITGVVPSGLPFGPTNPASGSPDVLFHNTTNGKLYRWNAPGGWTTAADGADLIANSITTNKIAVGSITTALLGAGAVTASKIYIGDTSNMFPDPLLVDDGIWNAGTGAHDYVPVPANSSFSSVNFVSVTESASQNNVYTKPIPIEKDEDFFVSLRTWWRAPITVETGAVYAQWVDSSNAFISETLVANVTSISNNNVVFNTVRAPATSAGLRFLIRRNAGGSVKLAFADPILRRAANGKLIVDGAVITDKLAANAVTTGKLAVGAVVADSIAAQAITASKMFIGDTSNMFPDPNLTDGAVWDVAPDAIIPSTLSIASTNTIRLFSNAADKASQLAPLSSIPVESGETYFVSSVMYVNAGGGEARAYIRWYSGADGTGLISQVLVGSTTTTTATYVSGKFVAPSNARRMSIRYFRLGGGTAAANFGAPIVRKATDGQLIVDGSILANHLAANSITSDKIIAGAVTAAKINVTNLAAIKSDLGAITAGSININNLFVVTSGGLVTIRSATSGQRVEMDQAGVRVYYPNGQLAVRMGIWA